MKFEDGQVKLQSRLEQEEEAKAALLSRIQRLTKLILVSTKASQPSRLPQRPGPRRRHSFGEEEVLKSILFELVPRFFFFKFSLQLNLPLIHSKSGIAACIPTIQKAGLDIGG